MASFEQNQQDQFNMNNSLDQVKQFQAELDNATASIGAAELEAEEELLGVRLKNLAKSQQVKLTQLGKILELEEKGIQELAKLKLTLSNRQFAIRKKEIEQEFKLYKDAAAELLKAENKQKSSKQSETSKKGSSTADSAIKKASRKVLNAEYAVGQVNQEITNAISALQEIAQTATEAARSKAKTQVEQKPAATTEQDPTQRGAGAATSKATETNFSNSGLDNSDKVEIGEGKFGFESLVSAIDQLGTLQNTEVSSIIIALESIKETGNEKGASSVSQDTLDLADKLVKAANEAEETIVKVRKFNENKIQNMRLVQLIEEQNLAKSHAESEYNERIAKVNAFAKKRDILLKKDKYLAEAENKLRTGHINKENELRLAGIAEEAKAKDLQNNRAAYELEARIARENAFAAEQNKLTEERIKAETEIAWNAEHRRKLLDQKEQNERLGYLAEYQKLQVDGFNHLTENMTAAEFEALRAETAAIEDAIKHRNDIATANEKALATLRGKGTLKEKKQLLEAQIKERAAQKDWSKPEKKDKKEASKFSKSLDGLLKKSKITTGMADKASQLKMKADEKANKRFDELFKPKITNDMSDEDKKREEERVQKNKEKAAAAEMALNAATSALADFAQKLSTKTDDIAKVQGILDTRLQGSRDNRTFDPRDLGSYGRRLQREAKWIAGASPYIRQEKLVENITTLVNKGISFNVKQRAFLMTIQEKIANTFDVADGTLLRLIRIQQQDTTAGRLGMESALNSFLNSMYETSEYLESVAKSVRSSLEEMQALMEGAAGAELEYQVQKWMGSLYSVGMSDSAVQDIAKTFGQIVSGDISGLGGSGTGNLLIMAANEAGMSIADILQDGLNADETNKLMQAMVNYLAEIAETSSDSRVVQQQLANVYGLKASDLKAVTNLATSVKDVAKADMSYGGMMGQLNLMMNTLALRTSIGEGISNMWNNTEYTMASSMAANPISYLLPKLSKMLKDTTGGIDLPFVNVMGFGVDLNTSVADLMSVAAMAPAVLGSLGPAIAGLTDLVNPLAGSTMLMRAGINPFGKVPVLARGSAPVLQTLSGSSTSESGYIGNSSGTDVKKATLQDAEDSKKKQMVEAKEEETADDIAMRADLAVVNIYNLLEEVAHGSQSLRVRVVSGGCNCNGGSGSSGSYSGGAPSNQNPIGDNSGSGTTSGSTGAGGIYGADNGNWVLTF